jgi:hypothetical protein
MLIRKDAPGVKIFMIINMILYVVNQVIISVIVFFSSLAGGAAVEVYPILNPISLSTRGVIGKKDYKSTS